MLTIQLGQAGNQVGFEFLDCIWNNHERDSPTVDRFFRETKHGIVARTVYVDTEEKVVASVLRDAEKSGWAYHTKRGLVAKRGAGNNWANGFYQYGQKYSETILDIIRLELEATDVVEGFTIIQSVAGGTGSGLGASVVQALNDTFPSKSKLAMIVWPFTSGETVVQSYNSVMSISYAYQGCEGIVLLENDQFQQIAHKMMRLKTVSVKNLNKIIASQLLSVLSSSNQCSIENCSETSSVPLRLSHLLSSVCPHPEYKLLSVRSVPQMPPAFNAFTTYSWEPTLNTLRSMAIGGAHCSEGFNWRKKPALECSYGDLLAGRTFGASTYEPLPQEIMDNISVANMLFLHGKKRNLANVTGFLEPGMYCAWNSEPFSAFSSGCELQNHDISAGLISNEKRLYQPIDAMVSKGWKLFNKKAYLHQYTQFGMDEEEIMSHFVQSESIVRAYKSL
eukprot:m.95110 g.95110  ORF g.95110 m.95110 type:complete len:449 (-) comp8938_c0_seq4:1501-2847(-)